MGASRSQVLDLSQLVGTSKGPLSTKYEILDQLGSGAQGAAYRVKSKADGSECVAKETFGDKEDFIKEFDNMKELRHPNCAKVMEMIISKELVDGEWREKLFVISELARGSDLHKYMLQMGDELRKQQSKEKITEEWCARVYRQAMEGVAYIHSKNIVHNDLKPDNILMIDALDPANPLQVPNVVINDFGCATRLQVANSATVPGDPRYQSPQSWQLMFKLINGGDSSDKLDGKTDVWSMGATLYELLSGGIIPFIYRPCTVHDLVSDMEVFNQTGRAVMQEPIEIHGHCDQLSLQAEALLRSVFAKDCQERPSAAEVLRNPWFSIKGKPMNSETLRRLEIKAVKGKAHAILLNAVSLKLQRDHYQACLEAFKDVQVVQDGQVTLEEFEAAVEKLSAMSPKDGDDSPGRRLSRTVSLSSAISDAKALFQQADVDESGTLDFNEFVAVTFDWSSMDTQTMGATLKRLISDLDTDGNGVLNQRELDDVFQGTLKPEEMNEVFRRIDVDGNGAVSPEELRKFLFEPATKEDLDSLAKVPPRPPPPPSRMQTMAATPECCIGTVVPAAFCLCLCWQGIFKPL